MFQYKNISYKTKLIKKNTFTKSSPQKIIIENYKQLCNIPVLHLSSRPETNIRI